MIQKNFLPRLKTRYKLVKSIDISHEAFSIHVNYRLYDKLEKEGKLKNNETYLSPQSHITLPIGTELFFSYLEYKDTFGPQARFDIINVPEESDWILRRKDGKKGKAIVWINNTDTFNSLILEEIKDNDI